VDASGGEILDVDGALTDLEARDARQVRLIGLKMFPGCSTREAAVLLGASKATADRDLRLAKT
jgi:hypothetical protein